MTTIFGEHIPAIGDVFKTDPLKDSGMVYTIIKSINPKLIHFKRTDGGVGNWNQKKFNEYINEKRLILI